MVLLAFSRSLEVALPRQSLGFSSSGVPVRLGMPNDCSPVCRIARDNSAFLSIASSTALSVSR